MGRSCALPLGVAVAVGVLLTCVGMLLLLSRPYTSIVLSAARKAGVFSSAEDGMRALVARQYVQPDDVQIVSAGTNSFDGSSPHVWYVVACVWGGGRADGSAVGSHGYDYDQPGSYFLDTKEGWVHVPEGALPEFVGFWMSVYGLAGPGATQAIHEWGSTPPGECVR